MGPLTYIITGAEGHLGTTLIRQLEDTGFPVVALTFAEPAEKSASPNVAYYHCDITKPETLEPIFKNVEGHLFCVIHCAALIDIKSKKMTPRLEATNVQGTKNVFALYEKYGGTRFIYVSTVDVFAHCHDNVTELKPLVDVNKAVGGYPISKALATEFIKSKQAQGKDAIIVYPGAAIGPYDDGHNAMVQLVRDYTLGKIPGVVKGGYALVDMRDVAKSILTLCEGRHLGDSFILAGPAVPLKKILEIAKAWNRGKGKPILVFPYCLAYLGLPFIALHAKARHARPLYTSFALGVIRHANTFSSEAAEKAFNFKPASAEEAIGATLDYLKVKGRIY